MRIKISRFTIVRLVLTLVVLAGAFVAGFLGLFQKKPRTDKPELSFAEIEQLAKDCSFRVHWYSQDGTFDAGTAFVMDSGTHGQKLLVTAFHYLWPDDRESFTGGELPGYIRGGRVSYSCSGEQTGTWLKNCVVISDANAVPVIDKDVAAFTLQGNTDLKTLPLGDGKVSMGEKLYLLADLWDTDDVHENCVYEATAVSSKDGVLTFKMDPRYGTMGASGGPIINSYGEVVAIHMAGDGNYLYGHTADSFSAQIDRGVISEIAYEQNIPDGTDDGEAPVYEYGIGDHMTGSYFDFVIKDVSWADSIGKKKAPDGETYMVLDVVFDTTGISADKVPIFEDDFLMIWDQQYVTRTADPDSDEIFGKKFKIKGNGKTKGKMAYLIPDNVAEPYLYFADYIYLEDGSYTLEGEHYFDVTRR